MYAVECVRYIHRTSLRSEPNQFYWGSQFEGVHSSWLVLAAFVWCIACHGAFCVSLLINRACSAS